MDSALKLKIAFGKGEITTYQEALPFIKESLIVQELLKGGDFDALALINRLIQFSEIPFSGEIPQVKIWVCELVAATGFGQGYSYSGNANELLVCYNAMITSVLIKLQYADKQTIENGVAWILKYQNMSRGLENMWHGKSVLKYGGCMKRTPCYIGLVKSTIALSNFKQSENYQFDEQLETKLADGLQYILNQQLYLSLSEQKPITKYITKLSYPFSYKTNVLELLILLKANNLLHDTRCDKAKDWLLSKRKKDGFWRVLSIRQPMVWVNFDKPGQPGLWLTYYIKKIGLGRINI